MKILSVIGARPNFMKIAPFIKAINDFNRHSGLRAQAGGTDRRRSVSGSERTVPYTIKNEVVYNRQPAVGNQIGHISHVLVHTGQHYDDRMSRAFFEELNIPEADINLDIGSGTHAEQVGQTMIAFEKVLRSEKPDWVVVVGDVNATLACSVTAKKECIKCCHIEAGLRSGDLTMPEEVNRLVTDRLSDLLLAPDRLSIENLKAEGVPDYRIRFVGNIMIDTIEANRQKAGKLDINDIIERNLVRSMNGLGYGAQGTGLRPWALTDEGASVAQVRGTDQRRSVMGSEQAGTRDFAVLTLHRPSNVDSPETLTSLVNFLVNEAAKELTLLWPVHPRAKKQLAEFGLWQKVADNENIILLEPLGYLDMLKLNMESRVVLTDSGGLQEECTVLGTPCLTLRENTERPVTLQEHGGTGVLVGNDIERIRKEFYPALKKPRIPVRPELWDGHTAERCLEAILGYEGVMA